ncbi:MAG TPA: methyltransferase domain-containing protein [Polyangiaceae bacterium]|nr:methyltransferase domain-containing protein [Polyangiaceae bacterium]
MANEAQAAAWDGPAGERWVKRQRALDGAYGPHGLAAVDAADLRPGDSVLDVGCGTGALSLEAARRVGPRGLVVGLDISRSMLALARSRAAAEPELRTRFEHADAQLAPLGEGRFDRMISRLGVMFFDDPVAAFDNVRRAVRKGGRLACAVWQSEQENPWIHLPERAAKGLLEIPAAPTGLGPGPFSFADPDVVRRHLTGAGLVRVDVAPLLCDVRFAGTAAEVAVLVSEFALLGRAMMTADADTRARVHEVVSRALEPFVMRDAVVMPSRAWLVTATRGSE